MTKVAVRVQHDAALTTTLADNLPPGQAHWWLRGVDSEFVRLPRRVRGDQPIDEVVHLAPGRYTLGVGPVRGGVRAEIEVVAAPVEEAPVAPSGPRLDLGKASFVITGDLDAMDRDAATAWLVGKGAKVTSSVSGKTSHLLVGRDPGPKKLEKAAELGIEVVSEADLRARAGFPSGAPEAQAPAKVDHVARLMALLGLDKEVPKPVEKLVGPAHFRDLGMLGTELWGIAIGPQGGVYNVHVDLPDKPRFGMKCNCRETPKPCKHGKALLVTASRHFVPPAPAPEGHREASRYVPGWE